MNPSHSSVHASIDAYSYSSPAYNDGPPTSYLEPASGFSQDASSPVEGWSDEYCLGLAEWSEADRALFEALVNVEVTDINLSSGSRPSIPTQSFPSYSPEPGFLHGITEATKPHHQPLDGFQSYTHALAPSQPTASPSFRETTSLLDTRGLMYPEVLHNPCVPEGYFTTAMPQPSPSNHHATFHNPPSFPYPSPSPEPSQSTPSILIAPQRQTETAYASHHPASLAFEHPLPEPTISCISPDLIYPTTHCRFDLEDDHRTVTSRKSSRASSRVSSSAPYPSPSPSPSPRTSSTIFASQRRNALARTSAPVASNTWQCPYCPYVQRNRRSPDLKRHVKTHTRGADVADWVCCGVPVMDAIELGVPATTLRDAQVFEFDGVLMVGGCRKAFSRRDALKRHLLREKGKCFGDAQSLYQRGNRESC